MKSSFVFTLDFVLHGPCCGGFPLDAIEHMDCNGLLLTTVFWCMLKSCAGELHCEKIPDIIVRLLLLWLWSALPF